MIHIGNTGLVFKVHDMISNLQYQSIVLIWLIAVWWYWY